MWLVRTFAAIQLLIAVAVESELAPAAAASQYNFVAKNVYTQSAGPNATAEPYMLTAISLTVHSDWLQSTDWFLYTQWLDHPEQQ